MYTPAEHLQKIIYESIVAGLPASDIVLVEHYLEHLPSGREAYELFLHARNHLSFLYAQNGRTGESFAIDLELLGANPRGGLRYSNILMQAMKSAEALGRTAALLPFVREYLEIGEESRTGIQAKAWLAHHFPGK